MRKICCLDSQKILLATQLTPRATSDNDEVVGGKEGVGVLDDAARVVQQEVCLFEQELQWSLTSRRLTLHDGEQQNEELKMKIRHVES